MAKREYIRTVVAYGEYFKDFKRTVSQQVIDKFYKIFLYIMTLEVIPSVYFHSVEGVKGLFEIRVEEGTPSRTEFDARVDAFILGERLKEERIKAGFTQEQLAERIGTRKSYISRVENGHADIQVSTLFKIFNGLGRRLSLTVL